MIDPIDMPAPPPHELGHHQVSSFNHCCDENAISMSGGVVLLSACSLHREAASMAYTVEGSCFEQGHLTCSTRTLRCVKNVAKCCPRYMSAGN
jgi:hypothetical protein